MSSATRTRGAAQLALATLLAWPAIAAEEAITPKEAERRGYESWAGKNDAAAARWFQQAADAGLPMSQYALARHYIEGIGVPKDPEHGMQLLHAAANRGVALAQSFLGYSYLTGSGVKADPAQGLQWLTAAAKQEDPFALRGLADLYYRGHIVERDVARGKRLLLRAAQLADHEAARHAAGLLLRGPKEDRDPIAGMYLLQKSATAQDAEAAYFLGREYLVGGNTRANPVRAAQWIGKSSDAGHVRATLWLSELYFKGIGVPRDLARAEEILQKALATATLGDRNDFAWDLVVAHDERLRDGQLAVRVLEAALQSAAEKSPGHIDTLAAAYAELRQFEKAVTAQLSAIDRMRRTGALPERIADMQQRLELYQRRQPYREDMR
jgi:TPR repeat protein